MNKPLFNFYYGKGHFRHAGLEELAPYSIRGHPDVLPTKVGNHLKDWVPVFTGNPGFRLEFTPMKIWAGMTILIEAVINKETLFNQCKYLYSAIAPVRNKNLSFIVDTHLRGEVEEAFVPAHV